MIKRFRILGSIILLLVFALFGANQARASLIKPASSTAVPKKRDSTKPPVRSFKKVHAAKRGILRRKTNFHLITSYRKNPRTRAKRGRIVRYRRGYTARQVAGFEAQIESGYETEELKFRIVETAYNGLGVPYRYGGTTTDGFDCSGFIQHVFSENGIKLGRSSCDQAQAGVYVPLSAMKPGDLIFFSMHRRKRRQIDHVGLYVGGGRFIHAASSRSGYVKISRLRSKPYRSRIVMARRVIEWSDSD